MPALTVYTTPPAAAAKAFKSAIRHPTLYNPKGDIVLVAPLPNNVKQLFRVLRSSFGRWEALHTALEHGGHVQYRTDEGLEIGPCIEMNDCAEDVADFVGAYTLDADVLAVLNKQDPMLPLKIGSTMRLAHKYRLDTVGPRLRDFFVSAWPQSLDDWDRMERSFESLADSYMDNETIDGRYADDCFPEPASAIRLARDVNVPEVLPAAFYRLLRIPVDHRWDSRHQSAASRPVHYFSADSRSAKWDLLNADDLLRLLYGQERIYEFMMENWAKSVFVACQASCIDPFRECKKHYYAVTSIHILSEDETTYLDPLRLLHRRFNKPISAIQERFSICRTCAESAWRISMAKRAELWDLLQDFFRVTPDQCHPPEFAITT